MALVAAECSADTVGRWWLDDYPVGTVLKVGDTFRDSVGGRDAVLCAVDEVRISCGQLDPQTEMLWQSDYGGALLILR